MSRQELILAVTLGLGAGWLLAAGADKHADDKPGASDAGIFLPGDVDRKPEIVKSEEPEPPRGLSQADAYVAVLVGPDGTVAEAQLTKASDDNYGRLAVAAAKKCRFKPALKGGRPVRCVIIMPFGFATRTRTELRSTAGPSPK